LADEHARLAKVWLGSRRYVTKDVDAFVGDVAARLSQGEPPDPSSVRETKFHTITDLRSGYRMQVVDAFTDELRGRASTV
jgi:hypothetical protein